jgi:SpoVK/Ycf46/Vps4 family AAA+-type ATPase
MKKTYYNTLSNDTVIMTQEEIISSKDYLESGFYDINITIAPNGAPKFDLRLKNFQNFHQIKNEKIDVIHKYLDNFQKKETKEKLNKLGFFNNLGILLHGKQGCGKTTIIKNITNKLKDLNTLTFFIDNYSLSGYFNIIWSNLCSIRDSNPEKLIVVVFEEFEESATKCEAFLKSILDGDKTIDNFVTIATTNYIDRIPKSLTNRPSRFKYVIEIENITNESIIKEVLNNNIGDILPEDEIDKLTKDLVGKTIDEIKHECLNIIMDLPEIKQETAKIGF